ncbi:MAG: AAA family ATPase [Spirochaetaceae bacterium]|nr:AAA family ATPase [Spirochaetaceae bacterium]
MKVSKLTSKDIDFTLDIAEPKEVAVQKRAFAALKLALEIEAKGYNVYVMGSNGLGKQTGVLNFLKQYQQTATKLSDLLLLYNFTDKDRPLVAYLAAGEARYFKEAMQNLVKAGGDLWQSCLHSESYKQEQSKLLKQMEYNERQLLGGFEKKILGQFSLVYQGEEGEMTADLKPVVDGKQLEFDDLKQALLNNILSEEEWYRWRENYYALLDEMHKTLAKLQEDSKAGQQKLKDLFKANFKAGLQPLAAKLAEQYDNNEVISTYLKQLPEDMAEQSELLAEDDDSLKQRYAVNVLVDNGSGTRPLIYETWPTYNNLFGSIHQSDDEEVTFTNIKAGALLKASGGFLVINIDELLKEEELYSHFRRVLLNNQVTIERQSLPLLPPLALKAEKIALNCKVIVLGNELLYELLYLKDEEFKGIFKVVAEFSDTIERTQDSTAEYSRFCHSLIAGEGLLPLAADGLEAILKEAVKLSYDKGHFTGDLSSLADLLREANYFAKNLNASTIDAVAVKKTLANRRYINNLSEEFILKEINEKILNIKASGQLVGKINALVVVDRGSYSFGLPALISAQTAAGKDGLINIEREVGLSGELHDKGVFILDGFIRANFGRNTPLSITMSLGFEQSYDGVEGDSATLAETCVIISSIAEVAIKQSIGVTGSMNQFGEVQVVGGVSDKVSGFYNVCKQEGLTGEQGVIIPKGNIRHLFLEDEILKAIDKGLFNVWSVETIEEALYLLTSHEVGQKNKRGKYPKGSLYYKVEENLKTMNN